MRFWLTSVMIYHRGASLSEQHTDLLICHCTNLSRICRTQVHVDMLIEKSSPEIAYANSAGDEATNPPDQ